MKYTYVPKKYQVLHNRLTVYRRISGLPPPQSPYVRPMDNAHTTLTPYDFSSDTILRIDEPALTMSSKSTTEVPSKDTTSTEFSASSVPPEEYWSGEEEYVE